MNADWVKQAVSSGGSGNLTLGSASSGYIDLATAIGVGPRFLYAIEDGSNREIGIGYLSATSTLVRETVLKTLVAGMYDDTAPAAITVTTSAAVTIAASEANLLGSAAAPMGNYNLNKIVFDALGGGQSTSTLAANRLTLSSFFLPCSGVYSGMNLYVSTAAAGGLVAGLYQENTDSACTKIVQTAEINCSGSAGQRTGNFAASKYLPAGFYILAVHSGGAIGIHTDANGGRGNLGGEWVGQAVLSRYNGSLYTYGATMPDELTMTAASWNNYGSGKPRIGLVRV